MKENLNTDFIKAIQELLPEETNLAQYITEILEIGKEASYRRLRNEVPFTFYEVALIARTIGISLDQIIGYYESKTAIFNLNLIHSDQALNNYCDTLYRYKGYLDLMKDDSSSCISNIANSVPYQIYLPYEYIMRFRLCRWLHQTKRSKIKDTLDNILIPDAIIKAQQELQIALQDIPKSYMIWDINLFSTLIKEIDYFHKLNFINQKDIEHLKEELYTMLEVTEQLASEGCYLNGNKIHIYLSNIHFEASYAYLEKKDFQISLIRLYSINSVDTSHPEVCNIQKEWIQTLKRYSTLITESGQMQRINFFNTQRKYVDEL